LYSNWPPPASDAIDGSRRRPRHRSLTPVVLLLDPANRTT